MESVMCEMLKIYLDTNSKSAICSEQQFEFRILPKGDEDDYFTLFPQKTTDVRKCFGRRNCRCRKIM
jgi:hypothetical protein